MSSAVPETSLPTPENPGRLASAATIVAPFQKQISDANAARLDTGKRKAKLVGILATPSGPSVAYAEWTKKACEAVGIEFEIWKTWDDSEAPINGDDEPMNGGTSEQSADVELEGDVEDLIIAANADAKVHGIMIYYPIFGGRQDTYLQQIVDPRKDVEGLHFSYCWNMYHNVRWISPKQLGGAPGTVTEPRGGNLSPTMRRLSLSSPDGASAEEAVPKGFAKSILPCTPLAIVKCLEALGVYDTSLPYGDRLYGKTITVVNRSEVVGRPLAALLSNDGAKVYSVDIGSVQEFNKRGGAIARAETLSGGDETSQAGRKRSSVVLEARAANSSRRLRPHHIVRPCSLDLEACVGASNVIISGVPSANFKIPTAWVPRGATTVNFSSEKNFEKDVRTRAALHLPAVGKMTIAMLQRNLLRLVEYRELTDADTLSGHGPSDDGNGGSGPGQNGGPSSDDHRSRYGGPPPPPASRPRGPPNHEGQDGKPPGGPMDMGSMLAPENRSQNRSSLMTTGARETTYSNASEPSLRGPPSRHDSALGPLIRPNLGSRGRASTLSVPRPSALHHMAGGGSLQSPTYPPSQLASSDGTPSTTSTSLWDWRRGRRDSVASGTTTYSLEGSTQSGTFTTRTSPLLFAPVGLPKRSGTHTQAQQRNSLSFAHPSSASRPQTPLSPLLMEELAVDDSPRFRQSRGSAHMHPAYSGWHQREDAQGSASSSVPERPLKSLPGRNARSQSTSATSPGHRLLHFSEGASPRWVVADELPPQRSAMGHGSVIAASPSPVNAQQPLPNVTDRSTQSRRRRRPPFSYTSLCAQAIASSSDGRMTLREIYTWISNLLPDLYSLNGPEYQSWQNTVRHNLSLSNCFVNVPRTAQDIYDSLSSGQANQSQAARGKGGWWTLDIPVAQAQLGPDYLGLNNTRANDAEQEVDDPMSYDAAGDPEDGVSRPPQRRRTSSYVPTVTTLGAHSNDQPSVRGMPTPHLTQMPSVLQRAPQTPTEVLDPALQAAILQDTQMRAHHADPADPRRAHGAHQQQHSYLEQHYLHGPQGLIGRPRGLTTSAADDRVRGEQHGSFYPQGYGKRPPYVHSSGSVTPSQTSPFYSPSALPPVHGPSPSKRKMTVDYDYPQHHHHHAAPTSQGAVMTPPLPHTRTEGMFRTKSPLSLRADLGHDHTRIVTEDGGRRIAEETGRKVQIRDAPTTNAAPRTLGSRPMQKYEVDSGAASDRQSRAPASRPGSLTATGDRPINGGGMSIKDLLNR